MDMLTKLKMLSNQLDNPSFAKEFSKGFEEFLSDKHVSEFDKAKSFEVMYNFEETPSNDEDVKNKAGLFEPKPLLFSDMFAIDIVDAA